MLTKEEIEEINQFISNSANPLFLFDNDPDGICAYLILKKHYKKGRGITIKSYPALNNSYLPIVERYNPDLLVVLDKAEIDQEFLDKAPCTTIWLDHHELKKRNKVSYYNPLKHDPKDNRPTTALAYAVAKENLWIAMLGCVFDYYIPEFIEDFMKEYPDLIEKVPKDPGEIIYKSKFGKLVKIFSLNMKGKASLVKDSMKTIEKITSPYEILNQTTSWGKFLYRRAEKLEKEYNNLLEEAKKEVTKEKFLIFIYTQKKTSFTSDLAGELIYLHPNKIIVIGREKEDSIIMSLRTKNVNISEILKKSLVGINGYGGGHAYACGASVKKEDYDRFIENLKKELK